jgi:hypothetical protein
MRVLVLLAALALPLPASALSCAWGPTEFFPVDGATHVPTNVVVRVVVFGEPTGEEAALFLVDAAGAEVPWTRAVVSEGEAGSSVWSFTPDEPLVASERYQIVRSTVDSPSAFVTFTTGAGPDTTPPDAPMIEEIRRDTGLNEWGSWHHHDIRLAQPGEPIFARVEVSDNPDFSGSRVVEAAVFHDGDSFRTVVGNGLCGGELDLSRSDKFVRVSAIDRAGNVSATADEDRARGCSTLATPTGWAPTLLLALLALRRRR